MLPTYQYQPYPPGESYQPVTTRFETIVQRFPDKIAVTSAQKEYTYLSLNRQANQLAHAIVRKLGPDPEPVALLFGHGVDLFVGILGVLKSGKYYVPLDPTSPLNRNQVILEDTRARLLVTETNHTDDLASSHNINVINVNTDIVNQTDENLYITISPEAYAYILYTSGSSGVPKGVIGRHSSILHWMLTESTMHTRKHDSMLMLARYYFSGSLSQIFRMLMHGGSIYTYDIQDQGLHNLADFVDEYGITIYQSVPTLFRAFMQTLETDRKLESVRLVSLGGEPLRWMDVELYKKHFASDCVFSNGYGLTEVKQVCRYFMNHESVYTRDKIPVGYPVEGISIEILSEDGVRVKAGEMGEVAVISRYISPGYWERAELSALKFIEVPGEKSMRMFLTGDLGKLQADGCLVHLGRKDSQVKIKGNRIEMGEIESVLVEMQDITNAVVTIRLNRNSEGVLVAYIIPKQLPGPTADEIRRMLAAQLPDYMIPRVYVVMSVFPLTITGKTDIGALPQPTWGRPLPENTYIAPCNPLEFRLSALWGEILSIDSVGVTDNFFELGGDSVKLMKLYNRLTIKDDFTSFVQTMFHGGTITELAKILQTT